MSSGVQQTTLQDVLEDRKQAARDRALSQFDGAVYGRGDKRNEHAREGPENECLQCGADIDEVAGVDAPTVRRMFADDDGNVPACVSCMDTDSWASAIKRAPKSTSQARYRNLDVFYERCKRQ